VPKFEEGSRLTEFASFSDEQVIARVVAGETALFEELMRRFNQCVYRVARAIVKDEGEAEDVMRQAYLNGFTHLRQFEERAKFSTWLTRIVIHEALGRRRQLPRAAAVHRAGMGDAHGG
jgi:RNA polymerase sigma-70 factor (ECF subfamily)